jgi:hypothetical protein
MRQTEKAQAQSRTAFSARDAPEDDSVPDDWIAELPSVEAELAVKQPRPLLQKKKRPRVVQPKNRPGKSSADVVRALTTSERIRFGAQGEVEITQECGFDDDWDMSDTTGSRKSGEAEHVVADEEEGETESDGGSVTEHCEAEAEDNEEEDARDYSPASAVGRTGQNEGDFELDFPDDL